jgi:isoquinoline 1-oxidoreductase subunit beta
MYFGNNESKPSRREFIKTGVGVAGAFVVAFHIPAGMKMAEGATPQAKKSYPPNAFIQIAPDESVTIVINKLEMGQGVNTSMAQLIAEELECDWTKIRSVSAPVNPVYNHTVFPTQMTGGSSALISSYEQHRRIGASMRQMLITAAAEKWKVPEKSCRAENGFVIHPKMGKLSYGSLAERAASLPLPKDVKLKSPKNFKVIGKSVARVDAKDKSHGKAIFGLDVRLPDMLYAVIARSPVLGGKLLSYDDKPAMAVKGVVEVVRFNDSVAVLAKNTWSAKKGRDALKTNWDFQGKDNFSNDSIMADFKKTGLTEGLFVAKKGEGKAALAKTENKIVIEYEFPYLAHACMEPMNCTISFDGKKAEIWAGHQMPAVDCASAAAILGISPENVVVNTVYAGGSFGRRANKNSDYVVEAAALAKIVKKPLKVVWTREDDMKGGYYRPMTYHRVEVGFDKKNALKAWNHRIVGQTVMGGSMFAKMIPPNVMEPAVVEGVSDTVYDLANFYCDGHIPAPNVTTLWWRSVGHTHTAFVMETMIDEVAHQMKVDPLALRKKWLKKSPRHLAVLDLLEKKSGWGKKLPKDHAWGLAIHESFKSVVGHVVEVSYKDGDLKIHRVASAVHCGMPVNPEGAKTQVEGAVVFGISAALHGEVVIKQGKIETSNFDSYPVVRHSEAPHVDVYLVKSNDPPTGLGEPGVPPIAPAIANAIFKITGKRLRKLPFSKELEV